MKMKNLLLIAVLFVGISAHAQYDPEAKSVLDAMSAKYKKMAGFSASFKQEIKNESAGLDESLEGKITVKGSMYKLAMEDIEVYNNGKEVWVYTPEMEEVTVSPYDPSEEEISPGNIYDIYKKGFKYALISKMGNGDRVIEMDPESRDKSYHKIRMIINGNNELKTFTVFERSGNKYIYTIQNIKPMSNLTEKSFVFDTQKFPNVEVIDFR